MFLMGAVAFCVAGALGALGQIKLYLDFLVITTVVAIS